MSRRARASISSRQVRAYRLDLNGSASFAGAGADA
jgi:hypothetical protein